MLGADDESYGYGYDNEINYTDNTVGEEEIPQDLDEATLAVEDAYINYLDSRKEMRELALSRGFYPVVAVDLNDGNFGGRGSGKSYGRGRNAGGVEKEKANPRAKVARARTKVLEKDLDTLCREPDDLSLADDLPQRHQLRHRRPQSRPRVEALPSMDQGSNDTDCQRLASRKSMMTPT